MTFTLNADTTLCVAYTVLVLGLLVFALRLYESYILYCLIYPIRIRSSLFNDTQKNDCFR